MHGLNGLDGGVQRKRPCVCARICVCAHACVHACIYTFMCVHSCVHVHSCMFIHVCALVCVLVCTQVCVFEHVHVPLDVYSWVYFRCGHLLPPCLRQGLFVVGPCAACTRFCWPASSTEFSLLCPPPCGTRVMDT